MAQFHLRPGLSKTSRGAQTEQTEQRIHGNICGTWTLYPRDSKGSSFSTKSPWNGWIFNDISGVYHSLRQTCGHANASKQTQVPDHWNDWLVCVDWISPRPWSFSTCGVATWRSVWFTHHGPGPQNPCRCVSETGQRDPQANIRICGAKPDAQCEISISRYIKIYQDWLWWVVISCEISVWVTPLRVSSNLCRCCAVWSEPWLWPRSNEPPAEEHHHWGCGDAAQFTECTVPIALGSLGSLGFGVSDV